MCLLFVQKKKNIREPPQETTPGERCTAPNTEKQRNMATQVANPPVAASSLTEAESNLPNVAQYRSTLNGDFDRTAPLSAVPVPLYPPDQSVCLVGKAGPHLSTKAPTVHIQATAGFEDHDELQAFVEECSLNMLHMQAPMQKLVYVGATEKTPEDQIATVNHIQEATERYFDEAMAEEERLENERRTNGFDFETDTADANKRKQVKEDTTAHINKTLSQWSTSVKKEHKKRVVKRQRDFQPGQFTCVISILRDPYKELAPTDIETEWAVAFWKFGTLAESQQYLSDTLQHAYPKWDHYIVKAGKAISLEFQRTGVDGCDVFYRHQVETDLLSGLKANDEMAEELKKIPVDEHGHPIFEEEDDDDTQARVVDAKHTRTSTKNTSGAENDEGGGSKEDATDDDAPELSTE